MSNIPSFTNIELLDELTKRANEVCEANGIQAVSIAFYPMQEGCRFMITDGSLGEYHTEYGNTAQDACNRLKATISKRKAVVIQELRDKALEMQAKANKLEGMNP